MSAAINRTQSRQHGAAIVEFAIVLSAFLLLLLGIIEMGRVLFTFNSAAEATRRGARIAVVTRPADFATVIVPEMQKIMPQLEETNVSLKYMPAGCTTNCEYLEVGIEDYSMATFFWPATSIPVPPFRTTLPVESLGEN